MSQEFKPHKFIGVPIKVEFEKEPLYKKKPGCPDRFLWDEQVYTISEMISTWYDYGRSGSMAHNMRPANLAKALKRGSWGVGRFYFRVRTDSERIFELYYDRAPKDAGDREGSWFLDREMTVIS